MHMQPCTPLNLISSSLRETQNPVIVPATVPAVSWDSGPAEGRHRSFADGWDTPPLLHRRP